MTSPKTKKPVSFNHINVWRMHRQYLDRPFSGRSIPDLIKAMGWVYSPGGSTPYLALWARLVSFKIQDLNRLVFEEKKLVQIETLRGCTMLLPRDQAELALRIRSKTFTELAKQAKAQMPVTEAEMEKLKASVLKTLHSGPHTMEQIHGAAPQALVRDFPLDLKRIGLLNSLMLAVNLLKEEGKILKVQSASRLDATDYSLVLTTSILPEADQFAMRFEEACRKLASQYFTAESPARIKDFAWWAGVNVTDAIKAVADAKPRLTTITVEGTKEEYFIPEADIEAFQSFTPTANVVNFIPYRDTFLKGQREIVDRFVPAEHGDKPFSRWKGKLINDPLATIIMNGKVIGVWEWNEGRDDVDLLLFSPASKNIEKAIHKRSGELAAFIRNNLGAIRLQGLDYGPHQMTCIHDLKAFWGRGTQVDVRA